jgi:hypothetical protein
VISGQGRTIARPKVHTGHFFSGMKVSLAKEIALG